MQLLSLVTFLPLVGAVLLAFFKKEREKDIKAAAIFFSLVVAAASLPLWTGFVSGAGFQFVEDYAWIEALNIRYQMGIDGISLLLVMLTTLLTPIVMASSWFNVHTKAKEYFISMLVLETGMIGAFCAQDLFLFYIFFEVMLVPMYLLIGIWGGGNRVYAAIKFFIYTLAGSLLMFFAILYAYYLYGQTFGAGTFNIPQLTKGLPEVWAAHPLAGTLCFLAFMLSFAIKTPLFPFHTWLPDAHTEAPTGGSVILAGVLLKLGTYGMMRFGLGFFPEQSAEYAPWMVGLAVIGIVYGGLMALAQDDLKKLVAYSSVSHLGFVVLGIFAFSNTAAEGAVLQMINHGLSTGLLFLLVGCIYERRHTRLIEDFGGLAKVMPRFAIFFMIATLASIGLPVTNGFVGEFMILSGSFGVLTERGAPFAWNWMQTAVLIAGTGVIVGAVYMLWAYQRVFFGKITRPENRHLKDLNKGEMTFLVPVAAACFIIGVQPNFLLEPIREPVRELVAPVSAARERMRNPNQPGSGKAVVAGKDSLTPVAAGNAVVEGSR